ncbi:MAG: hypothetical protein Q9163_004331 [Psora crenata]
MSTAADPERDVPTSNGPSPPKLIQYRQLTGINTPKQLTMGESSRPAPNIGIYTRVISEEKMATYQYWLVSSIINIAFIGQIVVAATLTALGASGASRTAITVLGSINTVVAGIQTYLKGQGLPHRIRKYQFSMRKLREYIEDREREFIRDDCRLNVEQVIEDIAARYHTIRQTAEDNMPGNILASASEEKILLDQKGKNVVGSSAFVGPSKDTKAAGGNLRADAGAKEAIDSGKAVKGKASGNNLKNENEKE